MSEDILWVFILNTTCSVALTGIVWFVQVVHYPAFSRFYRAEFIRHHRFHIIRTAFVVTPLMIIELATSGFLVFNSDALHFYHITGLIIVILIWLSTFLIQAPIHIKLQKGYNDDLVKRLIDSNWIRTLLWSAKSLLSLLAIF
jgi:hypothetical protein